MSTRFLPRESRGFLSFDQVLLSVTVLNWALTVHELSTLDAQTNHAGRRDR